MRTSRSFHWCKYFYLLQFFINTAKIINIIGMQTKSEIQYYYNNIKSDIHKKIFEVRSFFILFDCWLSPLSACNPKPHTWIEQIGVSISNDVILLAKGTSLRTVFLVIANLVRCISFFAQVLYMGLFHSLIVHPFLSEAYWGAQYGVALGGANRHNFATGRNVWQT